MSSCPALALFETRSIHSFLSSACEGVQHLQFALAFAASILCTAVCMILRVYSSISQKTLLHLFQHFTKPVHDTRNAVYRVYDSVGPLSYRHNNVTPNLRTTWSTVGKFLIISLGPFLYLAPDGNSRGWPFEFLRARRGLLSLWDACDSTAAVPDPHIHTFSYMNSIS